MHFFTIYDATLLLRVSFHLFFSLKRAPRKKKKKKKKSDYFRSRTFREGFFSQRD